MNIEQAIDILKNSIADYVIGEYCEKCADNKICDDRAKDCYFQQAIDIVVTAYEKEKETSHYIQSQLDIANAKLVEEKEKNKKAKEFIQENSHEFNCKRDDLIELEFDDNTNATDLIDILDGNW